MLLPTEKRRQEGPRVKPRAENGQRSCSWLDCKKNIQVYSLKLVVGKGSPEVPVRRKTDLQAPDAHRLVRKLSRTAVLPNLAQPGRHPAPLPWG